MAFAKREYFEDRKLKILRETNDWIGQMKEMGVVLEPKRSENSRKDQESFESFYKSFSVGKRRLAKKSRNPRKKKEDPLKDLPYTIRLLLELQEEDGKWNITLRKLEKILCCPLPRGNGVSRNRWTNALILAFLRAHPEYFKHTRAPCDLAMFWDRDLSLIEKAQDELPPTLANRRREFDLDPEMIRQGRYKDAQIELLKTFGYRSFLTKGCHNIEKDNEDSNDDTTLSLERTFATPEENPDLNLHVPNGKLRKMLHEELREALVRRHRKLRENDHILSRFWRRYRLDRPMMKKTWRSGTLMRLNVDQRTAVVRFTKIKDLPEIMELRVPLEHIRPKSPNIDPTQLDELKTIWTKPNESTSEIQRLVRRERHDAAITGPPLRAAAMTLLTQNNEKEKNKIKEMEMTSNNNFKHDGYLDGESDLDDHNRLLTCVLDHDISIRKLQDLLRRGHDTYITAISKVEQQNAYVLDL